MRPGYEWIPDRPLPAPPRGKHRCYHGRPWTDVDCPRCGWGPFGWFKVCAACRGPRPGPAEAGHLGEGIEQVVWVALLLIVLVVILRVGGVTW
jgi:hypothetical protein